MANEGLNIRIGADTAQVTQALQQMSAAMVSSLGQIEQRLAALSGASQRAGSAIRDSSNSARSASDGFKSLANSLKSAFAAYIGFESIKGIAKIGDQAVLTTARLQNVTGSLKEAKAAQDGLFEIAQRLGAPYQELAGSFARLLPAVKEIGGGSKEATALSEILITSAKLSGASSAEAASSAQQFAQALGSGVLQGDELKSILENNGTLARTLAGALGVSVGQLKKLGEEGKLTSDVVGNALLGSYEQIKAQSAQLPVTISGSFTKIENSIARFIEVANNAAGGPFGAIAKAIESIATTVDAFTNSMATGGEGLRTFNTVIEAITPVLAAMKGAFDEIVAALEGNFSGAFSVISDVVIPAVINAFELFGSAVSTVIEIAGAVISGFKTAFDGITSGITTILNALGGDFENWGQVSGGAVDGLKLVMENFGKGFSIIVEAVGLGLGTIGRLFGTVMGSIVELASGAIAAIQKAFGGDFAGAVSTFSGTLQNMRNIASKQFEGMVQDAVGAAQRMQQAIDGGKAAVAAAGGANPAASRDALMRMEKKAYGSAPMTFANLKGAGGGGGKGKSGGGGGGGASKEDGMAKAQLAAQKAVRDAELKLLEDGLRQQEKELKSSLDRRLISNAEYFSRLKDLRDKELDAEIKAKREQIAVLESEEKRTSKPADKIRLQGEIKKLNIEIQGIEQKRLAVSKDIAFEQEKSAKALDNQKASLREQLSNLTGFGKLESALDKIRQKFADLPKELAGSADAAALQRAEEAEARIAALDEKNAQNKELAEARIQAMRANGYITEGTAKEKLTGLERGLNEEKLKGLELERERAAIAGDSQLESSLNRQIELLKTRNEAMQEGAEEMKQFTDSLQSSIQSNIEGFLNGTKSFKDAIKGVFNDIVKQINSMIAKKISESITNSLMGGKDGKGGGMFGGLFGDLFGKKKEGQPGQQSGGLMGGLMGQNAMGATGQGQGLPGAAMGAEKALQNMTKNGVEQSTNAMVKDVAQSAQNEGIQQQAGAALQQLSTAAQQAAQSMQQLASSLQQIAGSSNGAAQAANGASEAARGAGEAAQSSGQAASSAAQSAQAATQSGGGGGGLGGIFGGLFGGGGGGGLGGIFGSLFGGFRASGGWTPANKAYVVGENGPELFMPRNSGDIVPNDRLAMGGGGNVNITVNTPDANSFRRASGQVTREYGRVINRATRRNG